MDWKKLQEMKCPKCGAKISDEHSTMCYQCTRGERGSEATSCDFFVGYERFQKLINEMMMPKKPKYDPDKVDRSNWEW